MLVQESDGMLLQEGLTIIIGGLRVSIQRKRLRLISRCLNQVIIRATFRFFPLTTSVHDATATAVQQASGHPAHQKKFAASSVSAQRIVTLPQRSFLLTRLCTKQGKLFFLLLSLSRHSPPNTLVSFSKRSKWNNGRALLLGDTCFFLLFDTCNKEKAKSDYSKPSFRILSQEK